MNAEQVAAMHPRTRELRALLDSHGITTRQAGELIGRKQSTVLQWRMADTHRVIPAHALEVLKARVRGLRGGER